MKLYYTTEIWSSPQDSEPSVSPPEWDTIKEIVEDAAELPARERAAFVRRACGHNAELRARVEKLLSNLDDSETMIFPARRAEPSIAPDTIIASRFRVRSFLGAGGMGEVYEAEDAELGGRVAVKVLRESAAASDDFAARFRREARIARRVTHPNVCRIFDAGHDGGRLFLTMELLEGETLAEYLRRQGKLAPEAALPILRQIAAGLDALHRRGIVHRDLKPGNVMLIENAARAVINDFGLARVVEQASTVTALSETGQVLGTPAYMAPEQLKGQDTRASTDVYAFGLVAYEMVTGEKAFPAAGAIENALKRILEDPPPPRDVPPLWRMLIMQCLERDPATRPDSAGSVVAMLAGETPPERKWGELQIQKSAGPDAFVAFDSAGNREVLLRLLPPDVPDESGAQPAVRRLQGQAAVRHPNLIPILGAGEHDGRAGYWSEPVAGEPLSACLERQGPFSVREAARVGAGLARAVAALHAAGYTHGQIDSARISKEENGRIRLSPSVGESEARPEGDVAAVGRLLFELLVGTPPVTDGPSIGELRPDLPASLTRIIGKALEPDPSKRFASADQLAGEIERASRGLEGEAAPRQKWMMAAPVAAAVLAAGVYWSPLRESIPFLRTTSGAAHAKYLEAQDALVHYYRPRGTERAIELFQRTIEADPKFAMAHAGLARANFLQFWQLEDTKYIEPAMTAASRALSLNPNLASARVTLGMLYTQTGKNDLAAQELDAALKLDSLNAEAYYARAELHYKQGRAGEAQQALEKAIDLAPSDWRFPHELGFLLMRTGKYAAAIEQCQQAVTLSPDNPRAYTNLALACMRAQRLDESVAAYRRAISLEPSFNRYAGLGAALEHQGKLDGAADALRKAVEISPSSNLAWGNLGNVYFQMPGREADAREALSQAVRLAENLRSGRPNDGALLARLGTYYLRLRLPAKGLPLLRQAAALSSADPQVIFQAAQGHEAAGLRKEALNFLSQALAGGLPLSRVIQAKGLKDLIRDPGFKQLAVQYQVKP